MNEEYYNVKSPPKSVSINYHGHKITMKLFENCSYVVSFFGQTINQLCDCILHALKFADFSS